MSTKMMTEEQLQAYEVANHLKGLPTRETLKAAYLKYDFDRPKVAEHFRITVAQLNRIKKALLGDAELPPGPTYVRQWNEVKWYTGKFPEWTHIPRNDKGPGSSFYKYH